MTVMNRNLRVELVSNLTAHSCTCLESFPRSLHSQIDDDTYRGLLHIARPICLPFLASLPTVKVTAMNVVTPDTGHKGLMPRVTPRSRGHNAPNARAYNGYQ